MLIDKHEGGGHEVASVIYGVNFVIGVIFFVMYFYQMIYLAVGLLDKLRSRRWRAAKTQHKLAVLISARNERAVIGELIKSIQQQDYPQDKLHVFVVADNCTDDTAEICRNLGCTVFERFNKQYIGKGYALNFAFEKIFADPANDYEAFIILDADNLLTKNYVAEMNKVFDEGYRACTSYRNSKNYAQNWISSGYGLWFIREAEYLNRPRYVLHNSCAISGTGFLVATELIKERGGWNYHLLTEDIEFTAATVITGEKIGYAGEAMLYDEQPITFKQSWNQRMRWAKGFYQVLGKHGFDLAKRIVSFRTGSFSSFDMLMNIMPALLIMLTMLVFNIGILLYVLLFADAAMKAELLGICGMAVAYSLGYYYCMLFFLGTVTTITEWKKILASPWMKIRTMFTFPLFMFTYVPIAVVALFKKVEWTPIEHTVVKSIEDMKR